MYRLSRECLLQLPFPRVFRTSIPLGLRMNQLIAWRSTGFSAAYYRDVGARWLAKYRGFNFFMKIQTFLFSNARNKTNDNFSVVGDFIFLAFFSAQHFDTRQSNKGDEDINPTYGGRQPYSADTRSF